MRLFSLSLVVATWSACVMPWWYDEDPEPWEEPWCLTHEAADFAIAIPMSECGEEVEMAVGRLRQNTERLPDNAQWYPLGDELSKVLEVRGQRLTIQAPRRVNVLTWPKPLPFPIRAGDTVLIQSDESSTTLFFEEGALAYHAEASFGGPGDRGTRFGAHPVRWEEGCDSSQGKTLDLVVGDERLPPGASAEIEGWAVQNLGAIRVPGESNECWVIEGRYEAVWIAETTEERYACMKPRPVGPVCTEGMIEATMQGELHEFGPAPLVEGDYEILAVLEESLIYRHASQDVLYQLSWPGALPIEADEEDPLTLEFRNGWDVYGMPGGQLAVARFVGPDLFPPALAPDGLTTLALGESCVLDEHFAGFAIRLGTAEEDILIRPGEEVQWGSWTYRLLFAKERAPFTCDKGKEAFLVGEGLGHGALIAHRQSGDELDR